MMMSSTEQPVEKGLTISLFHCLLVLSFVLWTAECFSIKTDSANLEANHDDETVDNNKSNKNKLFGWAKHHGMFIDDERIEIRTTDYGGRGLFASQDIPANTELIRIPYDLQLGVRQLADEGTIDKEMQAMAKSLPWEFIMKQELFFIPLSIALCAEKRKGSASIFEPYLRELVALPSTHAMASLSLSSSENNNNVDDDLKDLEIWDPVLANKIRSRREGITTIHQNLAPASLSLLEFQWAVINVCSRSLVRKRKPELPLEQINLIGEFASSDRSRMLPVIDLVNHGSFDNANVWVGHIPPPTPSPDNDNHNKENDDDDDYSTSLKSTRDIKAGTELLFDYGGGNGQQISNERLLLDYGFVLEEHNEGASISLEEVMKSIPMILEEDDNRSQSEILEVPKEDREGLDALIKFLIRHATKSHSSGETLLFGSDGQPSIPTLAIAIAMTCQGPEDVTMVLQPVRDSPKDANALVQRIATSSNPAQIQLARKALQEAAARTIQKRLLSSSNNNNDASSSCRDDEKNTFSNVARRYSEMCQATLQKAAHEEHSKTN